MNSKRFLLYSLVLSITVLFLVSSCTAKVDSSKGSKEPLVPVEEIVSGGPPKDGIPSIDNPKFIGVAQAGFLDDASRGMLVKVDNDIRFYPFSILVWHEIVNDFVGGKSLAITFCPLCATGIVFEREMGGTVYDFGTSGKLYQSNLVMYDRQTDSYWSQILGKAIVGRLTGKELTIYPSSLLTFKEAKEKYPNLKVLSTDTGFERNYQRDPYGDYYTSESVIFEVENEDDRLHPKQLIYAISIGGKFKAYHYDDLVAEGMIDDTFNGHKLEISIEDGEVKVQDKTANKRIVGFNSFWFAFITQNPDAQLWQAN